MRELFITTYSADYPGELVLTLPPKALWLTYCCRNAEQSGTKPECYVFKVQAESRSKVPRRKEVLRVRATLPQRLVASAQHGSMSVQVC